MRPSFPIQPSSLMTRYSLLCDMNRRSFLRVLSYSLLAGSGLAAKNLIAADEPEKTRATQFVFAQIRYRGGDWNPHPLAATPLMEELMLRTSVEAATARQEIDLRNPNLFSYPFLYIAGKYDFEPFNREEIEILRRFLSYGGFLLADDALGQPGYGFDKSLRQEIKKIFPDKEFTRLPSGHAALRSYYLLRRIGGTRMVYPYVEGINLGNTTPVIYCQNDLGGAWERDQLGKWVNPCTPGGEEQRRDAFHLGINLILYAMTENYKEDLIHVPFIRRRLSR
ncbi:MAG: DUF4159 domain-containing protein [Deltaproteobacteria bacterium]|nr:MAG: DUF4159 domain-containing protein [Deltaproteobacteria bacterium]